MKRRHVLAGLLLAFGCAPSGRRLREEAEEPDDEGAAAPAAAEPLLPLVDLQELQVTAEVARRPLLVFVIPEDEGERWRRGRAYGELLNHGDDAQLAPLALFEVVCAPISALQATYPGLEAGRDPWLVVVDRTQRKARARALRDRELDALARLDSPSDGDIDARMARLAALFREAAEPTMVERLAALEDAALSPEIKEELVITTRDWTPARIDVAGAAAATLYAWAYHVPELAGDEIEWGRDEMQRVAGVTLAAAVRDRLVRSRPPQGSRWARSGGCGTRIEGARSHASIGCGMGHVPERSRRFLSFYTSAAEDPAG